MRHETRRRRQRSARADHRDPRRERIQRPHAGTRLPHERGARDAVGPRAQGPPAVRRLRRRAGRALQRGRGIRRLLSERARAPRGTPPARGRAQVARAARTAPEERPRGRGRASRGRNPQVAGEDHPRRKRPPGLFDQRRRGGAAARPDRHEGRHQRHRAGRQGPASVRGQGPPARQPRRAGRADPHRRGPARHRRRRPPRAVRQPRIHPQGPEQSPGHRLRQSAPDFLRRRGAPAFEPRWRARRRTRIRSASCS